MKLINLSACLISCRRYLEEMKAHSLVAQLDLQAKCNQCAPWCRRVTYQSKQLEFKSTCIRTTCRTTLNLPHRRHLEHDLGMTKDGSFSGSP